MHSFVIQQGNVFLGSKSAMEDEIVNIYQMKADFVLDHALETMVVVLRFVKSLPKDHGVFATKVTGKNC